MFSSASPQPLPPGELYATAPNIPFKKIHPKKSFVACTPTKYRVGSLEHDMRDTNKSSKRKKKKILKKKIVEYIAFLPLRRAMKAGDESDELKYLRMRYDSITLNWYLW